MKTLYLLRHAKSSWKDDGVDDFDRPLNKRGRLAAAAIGRFLVEGSIHPSQVLCSSSKRTRETLDGLQKALTTPVPARMEKGLYLAEAASLMRRVKRLNDSLSSVMLIGHNPGLEQLALILANDSEPELRRQLASKFPTGSLAVLEADITTWGALQPGCAALTRFIRARELISAD